MDILGENAIGPESFEVIGANFGKNLRILRKSFGYSSAELSAMIELPIYRVTGVETGNSAISREIFYKLMTKLDYFHAKFIGNALAMDVWRYYIYEEEPETTKKGMFLTTLLAYVDLFCKEKDNEKRLKVILTWCVLKNVIFRSEGQIL